MKYITSINSKIKVCIQQEDRVICDDYVYLTKNVPLVSPEGRPLDLTATNLIPHQNLGQSTISGGVALGDQMLILGHETQMKLSLWKWNPNEY